VLQKFSIQQKKSHNGNTLKKEKGTGSLHEPKANNTTSYVINLALIAVYSSGIILMLYLIVRKILQPEFSLFQ
jgi:hypothetical protein